MKKYILILTCILFFITKLIYAETFDQFKNRITNRYNFPHYIGATVSIDNDGDVSSYMINTYKKVGLSSGKMGIVKQTIKFDVYKKGTANESAFIRKGYPKQVGE